MQSWLGRFTRFLTGLIRHSNSQHLLNFAKRYSAQLSFALFIAVFLTLSVGEGQAYDPNSFDTSVAQAQLQTEKEGFIGKPQIIQDFTVLTGAQSTAIVYTVVQGDSLTAIASRYNLSTGSLIDANNLKISQIENIQAGMQLLIPPNDSNPSPEWANQLAQLKADQQEKAKLAESQRLAQLAKERSRLAQQTGYSIVKAGVRGSNNGYPWGWCTWLVASMRPDIGKYRLGNAGQWLYNARANGLATGRTARPGAVAVMTFEGAVGHVAYVKSVSDNWVTFLEMNYAGFGVTSSRTVSASYASGYIYWFLIYLLIAPLEGFEPPTAGLERRCSVRWATRAYDWNDQSNYTSNHQTNRGVDIWQ